MTEEKRKSLHQTSEVLCAVYNQLVEKGEVTFPIQDKQIEQIDSIVKTVNAGYFGLSRFPSLEEKASAYFCLIIKDHPVTDGNKRLAVLWLEVFCESLDLKLKPKIGLDVLAISVERSHLQLEEMVKTVKEVLFG